MSSTPDPLIIVRFSSQRDNRTLRRKSVYCAIIFLWITVFHWFFFYKGYFDNCHISWPKNENYWHNFDELNYTHTSCVLICICFQIVFYTHTNTHIYIYIYIYIYRVFLFFFSCTYFYHIWRHETTLYGNFILLLFSILFIFYDAHCWMRHFIFFLKGHLRHFLVLIYFLRNIWKMNLRSIDIFADHVLVYLKACIIILFFRWLVYVAEFRLHSGLQRFLFNCLIHHQGCKEKSYQALIPSSTFFSGIGRFPNLFLWIKYAIFRQFFAQRCKWYKNCMCFSWIELYFQ